MQKIIYLFFLILILFNIVFVTLGAILYPIASIDAISIWYLKAKAIYIFHGNIPLDMLRDKLYLNSHPQYPLLIPFILYLIYLILGGINENTIALINPLFYIFIIVIVFKLLQTIKHNNTTTLIFTYIYSMFSPLLAQGGRKHSGDVDIFIVFINWIGVYLAFLFFKQKKNIYLYFLILIIMISSQIKAEGIFLASSLLFLPISQQKKILFILISAVPFVIWRLFIYINNIPNDFYFILPSIKELIVRSYTILYLVINELIKINNWYIFWFVFFMFIIFSKKKSLFIEKFILPSLFIYSFLFFLFYLLLSIDPKIYVPPSLDRVLLQLSPFYYLVFVSTIINSAISLKQVSIIKSKNYFRD